MERRTKLALLIAVALLLLGFGVWYLLQPVLRYAQPPALPGQVTPTTTIPPKPTGTGAPSGTPVSQGLKRLQDLAGIFVARVGSGASGEGFSGYNDVLINATEGYQRTLLDEQRAMREAHPATGPAFGIVTRVVAIDGRDAVEGADIISFTVQVQQAEDAGNPGAPTRVAYKEAIVSFEKQTDKTYLVNGVVWKDIER